MEKIKVNMTPCEDVKTIHASQNDNATRKWAFDLYDENGKIDSSSIKEQMIFDSRVGGTEQILPENTSDPTTSPIIADIQYPDSLRSEQIFTYRESPTQEDGQAKITHIKGNTVVFNQLVQNGNFADSSLWVAGDNTISISNNKCTLTVGSNPNTYTSLIQNNVASFINGHDYLITFTFKSSASTTGTRARVYKSGSVSRYGTAVAVSANTEYQYSTIINANATGLGNLYLYIDNTNSPSVGQTAEYSNVMIIDLTQLNNSAITDATSFRSYYNLPYYAYTTGKLLPFLGEELKAVGFNQWDEDWELGNINTTTGENISGSSSIRSKNYIRVLEDTTYFFRCTNDDVIWNVLCYDGNKNFISRVFGRKLLDWLFTTPPNTCYIRFGENSQVYGTTYNNDICINISSSENGKYEPYTSSTINLHVLEHFPTGMKRLPNGVYDEQTESKASLRIGAVTFDGTQSVAGSNFGTSQCRMFIEVPNAKPFTNVEITDNGVISSYLQNTSNVGTYNGVKGIHRRITGSSQICVSLGADGYASGITTEALFNQYLASHPLTVYYELATPTEESITTASLVTEKGESSLYYDDELIADCNENISAESGIFDAKIKLMTDETVYSQKIQLHVERKP